MSLANMTIRRIRKLIAWMLALVVLALLAGGVYYVGVLAGVVPS